MELSLLFVTLCLVIVCSFSAGGRVEKKEAWGYVNVRQDAYMFWWLYYTDQSEDYTRYPLVIWLEGGPGGSSTGHGNFMGIGPLDANLKPRNNTWLQKANLLFLDNPVGSGFSYVTNKSALATNNQQIASDLTAALYSILDTVPEFQKTPLYIFGESYGGKMAVDFALALTKAIKNKNITCNFKGVALGDPWISPLDYVNSWGDYLYATSYLDKSGLMATKQAALDIKKSLTNQNFTQAMDQFSSMQILVENLTNNVDWFNILKNVGPPLHRSMNKFPKDHKLHKLFGPLQNEPVPSDPLNDFMNGDIRQKLHDIPKNVTWGGQSAYVFPALYADFMKDASPSVDGLLNETYIDVNIYSGQLDLLVNILGTLNWVERLNWTGLKGFLSAPKEPITFSPNENAGYVKSFKQLSFFWILKAGHQVPHDAPESALKILDTILTKKKF